MLAALLIAVVLAGAATPAAAAPSTQASWRATEHGELILRPFASAPYPHPSRDQGFKSFPRDPHYTDPTVGIFIPASFVAGETVDLVVHFHGHKNRVANVFEKYRLPKQFLEAKINAILIVPQGPKDAADSGGGKLELDPGGFAKFINEVVAFLVAERKLPSDKVGRIVLSTHSGGYKMTAGILHHGGLADHITDVLLLDSSYGSLPWFADWCAGDPTRRHLVSIFTEHLADENKELMSMLDKAGVKYSASDEVVNRADDAATMRFVATKVAHDEIPTRFFGQLLISTSLAKPPGSD